MLLKVQQYSNRFKIFPENRALKVLEGSTNFLKVPESFGTFQNVVENSKI
jgi:hypothetical protein